MPRPFIVALWMSLLFGQLAARAADWNEWRGPSRDGIVKNSPPLLDAWAQQGPKKVWQSSDRIAGSDRGGYGSVVVAEGKVFVLEIPKHGEALTTRTLGKRDLTYLGWQPNMPPGDLLAKLEKARASAERAGLKDRKKLMAWSRQWAKDNLDAPQRKKYGRFATARLMAGKSAIDIPVLEKLAGIKDKTFPSQAELEAWFEENGIKGDLRKRLASKFPSTRTAASDVVLCLDASNGKTLWKSKFPGAARAHSSSSTPCVIGGRVYVIGSDGDAYCLDARDGRKIWHRKVSKGEKNCSFAVVEGVAIIPAGPLTGLDTETGKVLWCHEKIANSNASPVFWTGGGKTYAIVRAGRQLTCLDPKSGKIAWSTRDPGSSHHAGGTPAIEGDVMVVTWSQGVHLYKLSPEKVQLQAKVKSPMDYSSSPIINSGHAYVFGRKGAICINLAAGKLVWQEKKLLASAYAAPILADNKIIMQGNAGSGYGDGSLAMFSVSPKGGKLISRAKLKQVLCTTPALADGRVFCRLAWHIACFDLRK